MSEFAYPLDGEQNYTASQCGAFFAGRTSGVFSANGNLAVSVTGARQLTLSSGIAWINTDRFWGKVYCNTSDVNFTLPTADGALDMICRVVVRWNKTTNVCQAVLLEGTPSSAPVPPARSTSDELYDLVIADYLVEHGETEASAARLTDQRLNEDLCGLMRDGVERIPTDMLQAQAEALIDLLERAVEQAASGQLADGSVTTSKLADGAVTTEKISPGALSSKILEYSESFTLGLDDLEGLVKVNSDSDVTVTIPANIFDVRAEIEIVQLGTGAVTIAAADGVTIRSMDGMTALAGQYAVACLKKLDASTWLLGGALA